MRKERQAQDRTTASGPGSGAAHTDPEIEALRQRLDELEASRKLGNSGTNDEQPARAADFAAELAALESRVAELSILKTAEAAARNDAPEAKRREFDSNREALEKRVALLGAELATAQAAQAAETTRATDRAAIERSNLETKLASLEEELEQAQQAAEESARRAAAAQATHTNDLEKRTDALAAQIDEVNQARLRVEAEIVRAESDFHARLSYAEQQLRDAEQSAEAALNEKQLALSALESGVAARFAAVESANLRLRTRAELDAQAAQAARARLAAEDRHIQPSTRYNSIEQTHVAEGAVGRSGVCFDAGYRVLDCRLHVTKTRRVSCLRPTRFVHHDAGARNQQGNTAKIRARHAEAGPAVAPPPTLNA